jgi:hypothetical protein
VTTFVIGDIRRKPKARLSSDIQSLLFMELAHVTQTIIEDVGISDPVWVGVDPPKE